jgi:hypothetical protein
MADDIPPDQSPLSAGLDINLPLLVRRAPYNYVEATVVTLSPVSKTHQFKRKPDRIEVVNMDTGIIIYVNFLRVAAAADGYGIAVKDKVGWDLRVPSVNLLAASGTPKALVVAFSYKDERYRARQ